MLAVPVYRVNTLCIPVAVVYSESPESSGKVIKADEIAHQKVSIVQFAQRSLQIGIY